MDGRPPARKPWVSGTIALWLFASAGLHMAADPAFGVGPYRRSRSSRGQLLRLASWRVAGVARDPASSPGGLGLLLLLGIAVFAEWAWRRADGAG